MQIMPEESFPSGTPKMIFEKNLSWGNVLKFSQCCRQLLVGRGARARTCDDPCILERVLDTAFIQARVRLSCSNSLILKALHGSSPGFLARIWESMSISEESDTQKTAQSAVFECGVRSNF